MFVIRYDLYKIFINSLNISLCLMQHDRYAGNGSATYKMAIIGYGMSLK